MGEPERSALKLALSRYGNKKPPRVKNHLMHDLDQNWATSPMRKMLLVYSLLLESEFLWEKSYVASTPRFRLSR